MLLMPAKISAVHAYAAAINALNADAFSALFASGSEIHDPVGAPPWIGPEGAHAFLSQFVPLPDSCYLRAGKIEINGDHAAFTWAMEATGKNGRTAAAEGIDVVVFDSAGKIDRSYGYWDPSAFVAVLTAP